MRNTAIEPFKLAPAADAGATTKTNEKEKPMMLAETVGNIHIGLAFGGASIGLGVATAGGVVAMSRNPAMFGRILMIMLLGMALAEGWAVIAWIVVR